MGDSEGDAAGDEDLERLIGFLDPEPAAGGSVSAVVEVDWLGAGLGSVESSEGVVGLPLVAGKGDVAVEAEAEAADCDDAIGCEGESGVPSETAGDGGSDEWVAMDGSL